MKIIQTKADFIFVMVVFAGFLVFLFFAINIFSHFDPVNLCYIKLEGDIVKGNKKTVHDAIDLLKKHDKAAYHSLCQNVKTISEKFCIIADSKSDPEKFQEGLNLPGCYVLGTKTIYLRPIKSNNKKTIEHRAWAIKKYTGLSKKFWENYNSIK